MAKPVLTLSTHREDAFVLVDETPYRLVAPATLPLHAYHRFARLASRLAELWNSDVMSDAQITEFNDVLDRLCRLILEAPEKVHAKLVDAQRIAIYQAYLKQPQIAAITDTQDGLAQIGITKASTKPRRQTKH